jgi:predicted transcriptional regulator
MTNRLTPGNLISNSDAYGNMEVWRRSLRNDPLITEQGSSTVGGRSRRGSNATEDLFSRPLSPAMGNHPSSSRAAAPASALIPLNEWAFDSFKSREGLDAILQGFIDKNSYRNDHYQEVKNCLKHGSHLDKVMMCLNVLLDFQPGQLFNPIKRAEPLKDVAKQINWLPKATAEERMGQLPIFLSRLNHSQRESFLELLRTHDYLPELQQVLASSSASGGMQSNRADDSSMAANASRSINTSSQDPVFNEPTKVARDFLAHFKGFSDSEFKKHCKENKYGQFVLTDYKFDSITPGLSGQVQNLITGRFGEFQIYDSERQSIIKGANNNWTLAENLIEFLIQECSSEKRKKFIDYLYSQPNTFGDILVEKKAEVRHSSGSRSSLRRSSTPRIDAVPAASAVPARLMSPALNTPRLPSRAPSPLIASPSAATLAPVVRSYSPAPPLLAPTFSSPPPPVPEAPLNWDYCIDNYFTLSTNENSLAETLFKREEETNNYNIINNLINELESSGIEVAEEIKRNKYPELKSMEVLELIAESKNENAIKVFLCFIASPKYKMSGILLRKAKSKIPEYQADIAKLKSRQPTSSSSSNTYDNQPQQTTSLGYGFGGPLRSSTPARAATPRPNTITVPSDSKYKHILKKEFVFVPGISASVMLFDARPSEVKNEIMNDMDNIVYQLGKLGINLKNDLSRYAEGYQRAEGFLNYLDSNSANPELMETTFRVLANTKQSSASRLGMGSMGYQSTSSGYGSGYRDAYSRF